MKRKAQGLSMNTIIIAAIALIVLVVIVAIFTGRLGLFSQGLGETTNCNQVCNAKGYSGGEFTSKDNCGSDKIQLVGYSKKEGDQKYICCCKKNSEK